MPITCSLPNDRPTLHISGALSIYEAVDAKAGLLEALGLTDVLDVDLSMVSEIDTAGLQLLLLLKLEAQRQNKRLHFLGHSPAVLRLVDLYNLAGVFGDPVVLRGTEA